MSSSKKQVRKNFRDSVFKRDCYSCKGCDAKATPETAESVLDAHHITDRTLMPNGGYCSANGISLCATCHELAEQFHRTGQAASGFAPEDLYRMIGSSYDLAVTASKNL